MRWRKIRAGGSRIGGRSSVAEAFKAAAECRPGAFPGADGQPSIGPGKRHANGGCGAGRPEGTGGDSTPVYQSAHLALERNPTVKIYTKTGDEGITGLLGNRRVPKD